MHALRFRTVAGAVLRGAAVGGGPWAGVVSVLQCMWSGVICNSSWFTPVSTPMGYCFAFNAGNTLSSLCM